MSMFDFLAAGNNSIRGLVRRQSHHLVDEDEMIPNFSMRPGVSERLREARRDRRREDPFAAYQQDVYEREVRARQQKANAPRVRSTVRPEQLRPAADCAA